jgi:uncharacterized repeat protein (TIGR01451 family)
MFKKAAFAAALMSTASAAWAAHDLVLQHTGPDTISLTQTATYTVRLDNSSPTWTDTATGVALTYTYNSSLAGFTGTTFSNGTGSCSDDTAGTINCAIDDIPHGTTNFTIDFDFLVHGDTLPDSNPPSANLSTTATVTSTGDQVSGNESESVTTNIQAGTDLAVTLISSPVSGGNIASGAIWSHEVTVNNNGPLSTTGTTVTLAPAAGTQWIASSMPSGCSVSGANVECTIGGSFADGASQIFSGIDSQVIAVSGSALSLTASVESNLTDEISTNNSATSSATVTPGTDLILDLSESPTGTIIAGDPSTITVTPRYTGDVPNTPTYTVTIPGALTVDTGSLIHDSRWGSCNFSGTTTLTCSGWNDGGAVAGALQPMGAATFDVTGPTGQYTLSGNLTSNSTEADLTNNIDDVIVDFAEPTVDITISKSGPTAPENKFQTGTNIQYTVTLSNPSNSNVDFWGPLSFSETPLAGLTINSINGPAGWTCYTSGCNRTYTEADPFPRNSSQTFTVNATVSSDTATNLENQVCRAAFTHPLVGTPNDQVCDTAAAVTGHPAADSTDLAVAKTVTTPAGDIKAGDWLAYSITMSNIGSNSASNVVVSDNLTGLITSTDGGSFQITTIPADWSCSNGGTPLSSGAYQNSTSVNLSCTIATLASSASDTLEFRIRPQGSASNGNNLNRSNTAYIQSDTPEPDFSNNTGSVNAAVQAKTDFTVTKAVTSWDNKTGTELQYTITVSNANLSGANNVVVTDVLPENVTYLGLDGSTLPSCSGVDIGDTTTSVDKTLECSWSSFPRGGDRSFIVLIRPNNEQQGQTFVNDVYVNVEPGTETAKVGTTEETDYTNNTDQASSTADESDIDLQVNKQDMTDPVYVGDTVTYQVRITNNGPSVATNASIYDYLPTAGFKWVGDVRFYEGSYDPGNEITGTDLTDAGISCSVLPNVDDVGTGGEDKNLPGKLSWMWPPNSENWVGTEPDYNSDYIDGAWDSRILDNADIACNMGLLESGQTRVLTYTLEATERGVYMNHSVVRSQEHIDRVAEGFTDRHWENDVVQHRTTVRTTPDLTFTKEVSTPVVSLMEPFSYTITVTNNDTDAQLYYPKVEDTLPANMELAGTPTLSGALVNGALVCTTIPVPPAAGTPSAAGDTDFACALGEGVPAQGQVVLSVPVRVTGGSVATLNNTAQLHLDTDLEFDNPPPPVDEDNVNVDVVVSSIAGNVYHDVNNNGVRDGGEAAINGVTITLSGTDDYGNPVNATTTTAGGAYLFDNLAPGTYTVTETHPNNWVDGKDSVGQFDSEQGSGVAGNDVISNIVLPADTEATEYNFGELKQLTSGQTTASISGFVYHDVNDDGLFDSGESPISGVTIQLTGNNGDVRTTVTDAGGAYRFEGLEPGATYTVTQAQPNGWGDGKDTAGTVFTNTSTDNDAFTVVPGSGQNGESWNFGELTPVGSVSIEKTAYLNHDAGALCHTDGGEKELVFVNKDRVPVDITWCFRVTNTGNSPLADPVFTDAGLNISPADQSRISAHPDNSLPLQPGATAVWYVDDNRDTSLENFVSIEMSVVDANGDDLPDDPKVESEDSVAAIFGYVFDPPFGIKTGERDGQKQVRWKMVWVNDNVVRADDVRITDPIPEGMTMSGEPECIAFGTTTFSQCEFISPSDELPRGRVNVIASFGPEAGVTAGTVMSAPNRLEIAFDVLIDNPNTDNDYQNQAQAEWTPPDEDNPLQGVTYDKSQIDNMTPDTPLGNIGGMDIPPGSSSVNVKAPPKAVGIPVTSPAGLVLLVLTLGWMVYRHRCRFFPAA